MAILCLVVASCSSGEGDQAVGDPTAPATAGPAPTIGIGETTTPSVTPEIPAESLLEPDEVLDRVEAARMATVGQPVAYTFNSDTQFSGGTVTVVVDGEADPVAGAASFDTQITAPDETGEPVASRRSYVVIENDAWFLDEEATQWFAFAPDDDALNGRIAQGVFQSLAPAGDPPLVTLLASATTPALVVGPANLGGVEVDLFRVRVPMNEAYVALGPASYRSFLDTGVDIAAFRGDVAAEVGIDSDGLIRWVQMDLTPIFAGVAEQPGQNEATAAALRALTVTMKVQVDAVGTPVSIEAPVRTAPTPEPEPQSLTAVGDCFDTPEVSAAVAPVGCTEPHLHEVFAINSRPEADDAGYPGYRTLVDEALASCRAQFAEQQGLALETTTVEVAVAYPSRQSWAVGDRDIVCTVLYPAPTTFVLGAFDLRRSFGVVTSYGLAPGDCLPENVDFTASGLRVVDCEQEHLYEVFHVVDLTDPAFPGEDEMRGVAEDICEDEFVNFVGETSADSSHDVTFFRPSANTWEGLNDRSVTCLIEAFEPITGSLAGTAADGGEGDAGE